MKDPEENPRERRNLDLPIKLALRHHSWPLDFVSMFFFHANTLMPRSRL